MKKPTLARRFHAFTITQSLGAFNDNVFKMLLQLYVLQVLMSSQAELIISQATFVFTIPFVLFGPWAGYFADRYSKSQSMRVIKLIEIVIMLIGVAAFTTGSVNMMLFVLFLMATQSTFFSPCKMGFIPEVSTPEAITHANSWTEMSTFLSIILGTALTGFLLSMYENNAVAVAWYCVGFAVLGAISAVFIPKTTIAGTEEKFPWNPATGIYKDMRFLKRQPGLWLAALANSYFWLIGLLFTTNILVYGKVLLDISETDNLLLSSLPAYMGIGIAAGSMLAGRWSGRKVELGLVPLGGAGMALCGIFLYFAQTNYPITAIVLTLAGISGGLYIVPLYAYLQYASREHERGRVIATTGVLNGFFLVIGSLMYYGLAVVAGMGPDSIYLILGLITIVVVIYICTLIPEYFVRFCFWLLTHTIYNIRIVGEEHMPLKGPALLAGNHVTFVDAFFIGSTMQRFIRFIMLKSYYRVPGVRAFFDLMHAIPIAPEEGRESVSASLAAARGELEAGHVVCIFPEGGLTRDGKMSPFKDGLETILDDTDIPIIPFYLENAWGSIFSFSDGKALRKWPRKIPYPITVHYGAALPSTSTAEEVEAAVRNLAAGSVRESV